MTVYNQLLNQLETLELFKMKELIPHYVDQALTNNKSFIELIQTLTLEEIKFRDQRARLINLKTSHFPFHKTIEDFDFSYQPSINKALIMDLMTLRFVENNENILLIGSSGVGKHI